MKVEYTFANVFLQKMEIKNLSILENIQSPADLKGLDNKKLNILAGELRDKLMEVVLQNGGHLASNLGTVELTLALHSVLNTPKDRIIWDVGHQSYVHKMLTGRYKDIGSIRTYGGLSGFPKRDESEYDSFGAGHASTSVSAAVGLATADKLAGRDNITVAVAGDGAFTGGMIYEALNNIADKGLRVIVVLNDNEMSIEPNVGGMNSYFARLRTSPRYLGFKYKLKRAFAAIPLIGKPLTTAARAVKNFAKRLVWRDNLFENLGIHYYGPVDGSDIKRIKSVFAEAVRDKKASIVHIQTVKGKGFSPAEEAPSKYHGVPVGGEFVAKSSFSSVFGDYITECAAADEKLCAVTAAMCEGTGLSRFAATFPDRIFDVGIAEEHALTFSAALAAGEMHPVFAVYSTFAQRCYDQLIHDAALQKLPITLCLDRAGLVGEDGPTHHGLFDVGFVLQLPGAALYSPDSYDDLKKSLGAAFRFESLSAVRYPRGGELKYDRTRFTDCGWLSYADFGSGKDICLVGYGRLCAKLYEAALLLEKQGFGVRVIRVLRLKPLDTAAFLPLTAGFAALVFEEEGVKAGGFAEHTLSMMAEKGLCGFDSVVINAVDERFVTHGSMDELYKECGFAPEDIAHQAAAAVKNKG